MCDKLIAFSANDLVKRIFEHGTLNFNVGPYDMDNASMGPVIKLLPFHSLLVALPIQIVLLIMDVAESFTFLLNDL